MKKKYLFCLILAALGLCSCEEYFELEEIGGQPRMYVECYAGITDTTYIQLYKAMPINAEASNGTDYTIKHLDFTVNGSPATLNQVEKGLFWIDSPLPAGSRLSLKVETEETAPISATTTIPSKPSFTTEPSIINGGVLSYLQFKLNFPGGISKNDRFAISIKQHVSIHRDDGEEDVEYDYCDAPVSISTGDDAFSDIMGGVVTPSVDLTILGYPESLTFALCNGEDFEGKTINAIMMYDPREYQWEEITYDDDGNETGTVHVSLSIKFQVLVFNLSDESFGYLTSMYNRQGNLLAMLGITPPSAAYTNISGGYGVLGGLSLAESEIIDIADLL